MNIAFLIDNNYAEQLAVTIASILKNNTSNSSLKFFVLNSNLSEHNKQKIILMKKYKNFDIEFVYVDENLFEDLPTNYHLKSLNYARILLPNVVNVDKILFLDCDLLVNKDLSSLYSIEISNVFAGVVQERLAYSTALRRQYDNLQIKHYFNAGVILFNLEKARKENIVEKTINFINNNQEKLMLLDQCALNFAFHDNVTFINKKYNFQYKLGYSEKDYRNLLKTDEPAILHFVGKEKPYYGYNHPFEDLYYEYLKYTPFKCTFLTFKIKMFFLKLIRNIKKFKKVFCIFKYM